VQMAICELVFSRLLRRRRQNRHRPTCRDLSEEDEDEVYGVADSAGNDANRWAAANAQVNYSDDGSVNFWRAATGNLWPLSISFPPPYMSHHYDEFSWLGAFAELEWQGSTPRVVRLIAGVQDHLRFECISRT